MSEKSRKTVIHTLLIIVAVHFCLLPAAIKIDFVPFWHMGTAAVAACVAVFLASHLLGTFLRRSNWAIAPERARRNARICLAIALVLELLPIGAVCALSRPPEEGPPGQLLLSHFDPRLLGSLNLAPFVTCILTITLLSNTRRIFDKQEDAFEDAFGEILFVRHITTVFCSILPWVTLGSTFLSVGGVFITLLLITSACFLALANREK